MCKKQAKKIFKFGYGKDYGKNYTPPDEDSMLFFSNYMYRILIAVRLVHNVRTDENEKNSYQ